MATYSNNVTIKFVQAVNLSASVSGLSGLISSQSYTVPPGHFAIIGAEDASVSYVTGSIGASTYSIGKSNSTGGVSKRSDVHAPEGTVLTAEASRSATKDGSASAALSACIFKNTP